MSSKRKHILIAVAAGLVVAGGATAIAATQFGSSKQVMVSIQPPAAPSGNGGFQGRPSGGLGGPGFGGGGGGRLGGGFRGGFGGGLSVAATYLGVTQTTLQSDIAGGKTLAQVAKAQGKTPAGLVSAMVAATRKQLDTAVSAGQFTKQQEDTIVSSLEQRDTAMVNGTRPSSGGFGRGFGGGGFGGGQGEGGGQGKFGGGTVPA